MKFQQRLRNLRDDEARVLAAAMPPGKRMLPTVAWGVLWGLCVVALLATSAYLITRASLISHILLLGMAIVAVRAFAIGRAVFRYLKQYSGHDASLKQLAQLRVSVLERLIPIAPVGLGATRRGDLLTRLVEDVDELQFLPLRVAEPVATALLVSALSVIGVALVSAPAAVTLLVCLVLAFIIAVMAQLALSGRADREVAPLRATLSDRIHDTITNLDTLRAYGAIEQQLSRVADADARLRRALVRRSIGEGVVTGTLTVFSGIATIGALLWGVDRVVLGEVIPELLTLIVLVPMALFEVFSQVPTAIAAWRRVRVAAGRVVRVAPSEVPEQIPVGSRAGVPLPEGPLDLELQDVSVRWPYAAGEAISQLSLRIPAGSRLLITGESGAGKTTIANTLVRFLDYHGSYRVSGVQAREIDPDELRRGIGLIEQHAHLFDESIRQNLLFANTEASDEDLERVLDRVGLGDWMRERGGLDAPVGQRGQLVSGGQAQRIALARALLAKFRVLILDEPTANVDPARAELLVRDLLTAADPDHTVILISHTPVDPHLLSATLAL